MPLPLPPANETITVYRGNNVSAPYPGDGTKPALGPLKAYVKHHMKNGRMGNTAAPVHWTHKLLIPLQDVRDAYNAELGPGPAEVVGLADTILIGDYVTVGTCCAFLVVHINRHQRGGSTYLAVYLDRFQPNYGNPCAKLPAQVQLPDLLPQNCGGGLCPQVPGSWLLTTGLNDFSGSGCVDCTSLNNRSWVLTYAPFGPSCTWQSVPFSFCTDNVLWTLFDNNTSPFGKGWTLKLQQSTGFGFVFISYQQILYANWNCLSPNSFFNPLWGFGCASAPGAQANLVPT